LSVSSAIQVKVKLHSRRTVFTLISTGFLPGFYLVLRGVFPELLQF
jgi:hypothetical protein